MICRVLRIVAPALLASVLTAPLRAQQVLLSTHGVRAGDRFGTSVSVGPDLDGDGFAEIAVGAPGMTIWTYPIGGAVILSGRDFGVVRTIYGTSHDDALGSAVAWCGDVDGDGVGDLAIGAPNHKGVGRNSGRVVIHSGATGLLIREIRGATAGGAFGQSLADLGDTNGDGIDDLLVGAPFDSTNGAYAGLVVVCSGADGSVLQSIHGDPGAYFGTSIANVGDVDGDGVDDLAAGAPGADGVHHGDNAGSVRVHSGATGAKLLQFDGSDAKCYGSYSWYFWVGDGLGIATGAAGDFDGDGVPDVWAASIQSGYTGWGCTGVGYLAVYSGATGATLQKIDSPSDSQRRASAIGDVDGDGRTDFIVSDDALEVGLMLFSTASGRVIWVTDVPKYADLGSALAPVGDFDGDGRPDFLVGTPYDIVSGPDAGMLLLLGSSDFWLEINSHVPGGGWWMEMRANLGPPGNPAALVLTGVNGAPLFDVVAVTTFDATGSALLASGWVPNGLKGMKVSLRALAVDASGRIVDSIDEVIELQ